MSDLEQINIFKALDFIRDNSEAYANAKAQRIYLEEFRKTKKAILMKQAEMEGAKTTSTQERDAYANQEYMQLLEGLKLAVAEEERLRWMIEAARLKTDVWRTLESNKRAEAKSL